MPNKTTQTNKSVQDKCTQTLNPTKDSVFIEIVPTAYREAQRANILRQVQQWINNDRAREQREQKLVDDYYKDIEQRRLKRQAEKLQEFKKPKAPQ